MDAGPTTEAVRLETTEGQGHYSLDGRAMSSQWHRYLISVVDKVHHALAFRIAISGSNGA